MLPWNRSFYARASCRYTAQQKHAIKSENIPLVNSSTASIKKKETSGKFLNPKYKFYESEIFNKYSGTLKFT